MTDATEMPATESGKSKKIICLVLGLLTLIDILVPDKIPYIDEIILMLASAFSCTDFRSRIKSVLGK